MAYVDKEKQAAASRRYYERNKELVKSKTRRNSAVKIAAQRAMILDHLLKHPCVDCGESDPIVLDFDHIDGKTKCFSIANRAGTYSNTEKLVAEMAKCEIRCANCHRRKTYKELGHKSKTSLPI